MRRLATGFIALYRACVSPFLGNCCRFYPSCSEYTQQAISRYGVIKGSVMGLRRVSRCHPWHEGGVDPVPTGKHST